MALSIDAHELVRMREQLKTWALAIEEQLAERETDADTAFRLSQLEEALRDAAQKANFYLPE